MIKFPIAGGFYESEALPLSHQSCVNFYVNIAQTQTEFKEGLFSIPGLSEELTTGSNEGDACRGAHVFLDIPYFVNGTTLYQVNRAADNSLSATALGTISGAGRVSMADNGTQLMILVPGGNGYIYTGGVLSQITDTDFTASGAPQIVVFIDAYFVCNTDTKRFIVSNLNDGLNWDALDYGTAEADPDPIVAPTVFNNQLILFGSITFELFNNVGGALFPFQRVPGAVINKGLASPFGVTEGSNAFYFIGQGDRESAAIWRSTGGQPEKVSTTAIEVAIQANTDDDIANTFAFSYADHGAFFVGFTIGNDTFVYDEITNIWAERSSFIASESGRWRVNALAKAYGKILVGDYKSGIVGNLSKETFSEYGNDFIRSFSTQPLSNESEALFVPELELVIESGVGNDDVADPLVWIDWSDDGKTWSEPRFLRMGKRGEFDHRLVLRRLGRVSRFRTFRFTCSDRVKFSALALYLGLAA